MAEESTGWQHTPPGLADIENKHLCIENQKTSQQCYWNSYLQFDIHDVDKSVFGTDLEKCSISHHLLTNRSSCREWVPSE